MAHDFERFPELTNGQMQFYYWQSPHKQITEDFTAEVIKVVDGDTVRVKVDFRDFDFPVRFANTNAPEMSEGGEEAREILKGLIEGKTIEVLVNKSQRVGKWGRMLGVIMQGGININEEMIRRGLSTSFMNRNEGKIPNWEKELIASGIK